jgi:glutaredoxin
MNIPEPSEHIFTIYSKSNCIYCTKVELLFEDYFENEQINSEYKKIICDSYIETKNNKEYFINFIEKLANVKPNTFPMVFYGNQFIGGFKETEEYLKCKVIKFDEDF